MKKIFILMGNPDKDGTLSQELADVYENAAREAGHEVRRANVGDLQFDPILHKGYRAIQALEPDLVNLQEDIKWSDHLLIVFPLWWSSVPSLLKGLIDRMWLPGFAFRFIKTPDGKSTMGWHRLLKGRTARLVVLMKNNPLLERFMYGDYTAEMAHAVLGFSGIKTKITEIGNSEGLSQKEKSKWHARISQLARKGS